MGKFIPVDLDRWAELVKAAGERDAFLVEIDRLKAEIAKSEEHNNALCERLQDLNGEVHTASCTNARLHSQFANSEQENARLKAEVERLRKAGDELAEELIGRYFGNRLVTDWNAAKEGKQS